MDETITVIALIDQKAVSSSVGSPHAPTSKRNINTECFFHADEAYGKLKIKSLARLCNMQDIASLGLEAQGR